MAAAAGSAHAVGPRWWRRLTIRHVWYLIPALAPIIAVIGPVRDGSFLWHVRAGIVQSEAGEVLRADPFSFTKLGEAWRTQSWLMELAYANVDGVWGGFEWVPAFRFVLAAVVIVAVMISVYRVTRSDVVTVAAGIVTFWIGSAYFVPRPVIGSFALLAVTALALHQRRSWAIVPLLWVWAAVHGSFVLGIGLVVLEALRSRRRDLWEVAAAGVVVVSLTAHGWAVWSILLEFLQNRGALDFISEWARPDLTRPELWPMVLVLIGIGIAAYRGGLQPRDLIVVIPFILFGLSSLRAVFPAYIVLAPYAAAAMPRRDAVRRPSHGDLIPAILGAALITAAVAVVVAVPVRLGDKFPVDLVATLPAERLLHDEVVGGYLIYARPDIPVYIDDRAELYGAEFFEEFLQGEAGETDLAAMYRADRVLAADDAGLIEFYRSRGWVEEAAGGGFTVLRRP